MIGKRHDLTESDFVLDYGEYGIDERDGKWYCKPPRKDGLVCGHGNLSAHNVIEHEDGTITVSPSILIISHGRLNQWHGYLERGIWREV